MRKEALFFCCFLIKQLGSEEITEETRLPASAGSRAKQLLLRQTAAARRGGKSCAMAADPAGAGREPYGPRKPLRARPGPGGGRAGGRPLPPPRLPPPRQPPPAAPSPPEPASTRTPASPLDALQVQRSQSEGLTLTSEPLQSPSSQSGAP